MSVLELDVFTGKLLGLGMYLYENGVEVKGIGNNAGKEYRNGVAALMGEPAPGN